MRRVHLFFSVLLFVATSVVIWDFKTSVFAGAVGGIMNDHYVFVSFLWLVSFFFAVGTTIYSLSYWTHRNDERVRSYMNSSRIIMFFVLKDIRDAVRNG